MLLWLVKIVYNIESTFSKYSLAEVLHTVDINYTMNRAEYHGEPKGIGFSEYLCGLVNINIVRVGSLLQVFWVA